MTIKDKKIKYLINVIKQAFIKYYETIAKHFNRNVWVGEYYAK